MSKVYGSIEVNFIYDPDNGKMAVDPEAEGIDVLQRAYLALGSYLPSNMKRDRYGEGLEDADVLAMYEELLKEMEGSGEDD